MDLSKAFASLNHELLIAKLRYYGLDQHSVERFRRYLSNCYQCCKINNTLGDWRKIIKNLEKFPLILGEAHKKFISSTMNKFSYDRSL